MQATMRAIMLMQTMVHVTMLVQVMMKTMGDDGVCDIIIPTQIINDCKSMGTKYRSNNYKR
jgi:hypothetical protein